MSAARCTAWARTLRATTAALLGLWLLLGGATARAQPAPDGSESAVAAPEIAARVTPLRGQVGITLPGDPAPMPADNRPLVGGERIETAGDARALIRLGSTALRLGPHADLVLRQLAATQVVIDLGAGSAALQIETQDWADRIVLLTPEGRWRALRPGHYRIDRWGDATRATAWEGDLRFDAADRTLIVPAGRFAEVSRSGVQAMTDVSWGEPVADEFAEWVQRDARIAAQAAALRYVSPEVVGWDDLDRHGEWVADPQWGSLWLPGGVGAGWTPYLDGRWVWIVSWGWTWVDTSPWGFAPYHYGRWLRWHGRWAWTPGPRHSPPRFAPAPPQWPAPPRTAPGPHPPPPAGHPPDRALPHPPYQALPGSPEPPRTGRPGQPVAPPVAPGAPHDRGSPGWGEGEHRRHREPVPDVSRRPDPTPPGVTPPGPTPPRRDRPVDPNAPGALPPHRPPPQGPAPPRPPAAPVPAGQGGPLGAPGATAPPGSNAPRHGPATPPPAAAAPGDPGRAPSPGMRQRPPGEHPATPAPEPIRTRPAEPPREQATGTPPGGRDRPAMR